ncbi:MAG: hypothetical protein CMP21_03700 [Rickettsiales bacterium]|nr:hypothetical protein [Rickettsiales bacterium]|tara:strand:- start:691 stop:1980 length:1290 start_codon:yes stop_codon:yes gene_type:complete
MGLKDLKNKLKSVGVETSNRFRNKAEKNLRDSLIKNNMDYGIQNNIKNSIQNGKIEVSDRSLEKIAKQNIKVPKFSTPKTKSEIKNFEKGNGSEILQSASEIGMGGSPQIIDHLKEQVSSKMEDLISKTKSKVLQPLNDKVEKKISKAPKSSKSAFDSKNSNVKNHPAYKTKTNAYESKVEYFKFVADNQPRIIFEIDGLRSIDTEDSQGNKASGGKARTKTGGVEPLKKVAFPIPPGMLTSTYGFVYDTQEKIGFDADSITTKLSKSFLGKAMGKAGAIGDAVLREEGVAINPNQEQVFSSVDFRSLTFEFEVFPKNEKESEHLDRVIHMFKYFSSPSKSGDAGLFLRYPNLWKISYSDGVGGSAGVAFQTKHCYCQKVEIGYGSADGYMLFKSTNKPTSVRISLAFVENAYILRDDIGTTYTGGGKY